MSTAVEDVRPVLLTVVVRNDRERAAASQDVLVQTSDPVQNVLNQWDGLHKENHRVESVRASDAPGAVGCNFGDLSLPRSVVRGSMPRSVADASGVFLVLVDTLQNALQCVVGRLPLFLRLVREGQAQTRHQRKRFFHRSRRQVPDRSGLESGQTCTLEDFSCGFEGGSVLVHAEPRGISQGTFQERRHFSPFVSLGFDQGFQHDPHLVVQQSVRFFEIWTQHELVCVFVFREVSFGESHIPTSPGPRPCLFTFFPTASIGS